MAGTDDLDDETLIELAVMAAGAAAVMFPYQNWWNSTSSDSADSSSPSSSTDSTARSRRTARKRGRELTSKIESLSSQIKETREGKRKTKEAGEDTRSREDCSLTVHSEIMKCEGYNEASFRKAFDYLLEHEDHGRDIHDKLRQARLADFFSSKHQKP